MHISQDGQTKTSNCLDVPCVQGQESHLWSSWIPFFVICTGLSDRQGCKRRPDEVRHPAYVGQTDNISPIKPNGAKLVEMSSCQSFHISFWQLHHLLPWWSQFNLSNGLHERTSHSWIKRMGTHWASYATVYLATTCCPDSH
jgi:hypothetical protein